MTQLRPNAPSPPHGLLGPLILVALLVLAELVWRVAAYRWEFVHRIGVELVRRMHPDMLLAELLRQSTTDIARAPEMRDIINSYSHAAWMLAAFVLAWGAVRLAKSTIKPDLWVPSAWVALLPVAVVGGIVAAFAIAAALEPSPEERTIQAEMEQATGTGALSYDRVVTLLSTCHDSIRKRFKGKEVVIIDDGMVPAGRFVYTYEQRGIRFVRIAASDREVSSASIGAPIRVLMPPIQGHYVVAGLVIYSGDDPKVSWRDYREYYCSMDVKGDRYDVGDLQINIIR